MQRTLSTLINTFSQNGRRDVTSILSNVRYTKEQLTSALNNVNNLSGANYIPARIPVLSVLDKDNIVDMFRDLDYRLRSMYNSANAVSVILSSMVDIFNSELSKIEQDYNYLERYIDHYYFLSGQDDFYNNSYIENFDDDDNSFLNEENDFSVPDRDGSYFSYSNGEFGIVDTTSDVFKNINEIEDLTNVANVSKIQVDQANWPYKELKNNPISNILINDPSLSWNVSIKSPIILTSQIEDVNTFVKYPHSDFVGAQFSVFIPLNQMIHVDTLRIAPNATNGLELLQIVLFPSETQLSDYKTVLSNSINIDKVKDITFDETDVKAIKLIFNQRAYVRINSESDKSEEHSKSMFRLVQDIRAERALKHDILQDLIYQYFLNDSLATEVLKNTFTPTEILSYKFPIENDTTFGAYASHTNERKTFQELDNEGRFNNEYRPGVITQSILSFLVGPESGVFKPSVYRQQREPRYGLFYANQSNDFHNNLEPDLVIANPDTTSLYQNIEPNEGDGYEYNLSIKSIGIFNQFDKTTKACFVSRKIPTEGKLLSVKLSSEYDIPKDPTILLGNQDLNSVEFSISVKDRPSKEEDWLPILPYNQNTIESERLFFDNSGKAKLRFPAIFSSIEVFEDGNLIPLRRALIIENINGSTYILTADKIDPRFIYTVSYEIDKSLTNPNEIEFTLHGDNTMALRTFTSSGQSGEYFNGNLFGNKVTLTFNPYVDVNSVNGYQYSALFGTINNVLDAETYSPVSVVLDDGTVAINLTNYLQDSFIKPVFPNQNALYFVQTGRDIIFNRQINQGFRVIYQYIPYLLRFRVVIRNNVSNKYSVATVDNVALKAKTINSFDFQHKVMRIN